MAMESIWDLTAWMTVWWLLLHRNISRLVGMPSWPLVIAAAAATPTTHITMPLYTHPTSRLPDWAESDQQPQL